MRCFWVNLNNPLYVEYHDKEWGVPLHDDGKLFELLTLECFQAGLSWECVLNKREAFRKAFDDFDAGIVASYTADKIDELMQDTKIIRHRLKIKAAIRNAQIYLDIQQEYGSFDCYIRRFSGNKIIIEHCDQHTSSALSDAISRDLKKRGMSFVGTTTIYSFLQACGVINGHSAECFLSPSKQQELK